MDAPLLVQDPALRHPIDTGLEAHLDDARTLPCLESRDGAA